MKASYPPKNGKRALVTGITGQDGSYLAELLLAKGYEVYGMVRRSSSINTGRLDHIYQDPHEADVRLQLVYGDLADGSSLDQLVKTIRPNEIYNLGAQSHVRVSFDIPEYTSEITGLGCIRLLEAIRDTELTCHFFQASSSEMYGRCVETPQTEKTPFYPRSPYACAKVFAFDATRNYRESYGMFAVNGIMFNHESPRRGETFVTRKITRAVARIVNGQQECLYLGNLAARRDWGYAADYVEAMWQMMQADTPSDYVIATGECHSVREFCELAFQLGGLPITWRGTGVDEIGVDGAGKTVVKIDPRYFRPAEVDEMKGDATRIREKLNWTPRVTFPELVRLMLESDIALVKGGSGGG